VGNGSLLNPLSAFAKADPFIQLDPAFAAASPDISLVFSYGR
jgi:hypothetical protein